MLLLKKFASLKKRNGNMQRGQVGCKTMQSAIKTHQSSDYEEEAGNFAKDRLTVDVSVA